MVRERRIAVAAVVTALGASIACARDVVVGIDPTLPGEGDAGGGGAGGSSSGADAAAEAATASEASALTAVARDGTTLFVGGWASNTTALDATGDLWMGRLDGEGNELGGMRVDVAGQLDSATGVASLGSGAWIVAGTATTTFGRRGWVRQLGAPDVLQWTASVEGPSGGEVELQAIGRGLGATFVVGGNESTATKPNAGFVARLDANGATVWRTSIDTPLHPSGQGAAVYSVAATVVDQVLAGGQRRRTEGGVSVAIPIMMQLSNAGEIYNSVVDFGAPVGNGTLRGIVPEANRDATVCLDDDGSVVVARLDVSFVVVSSNQYRDPRGPITLGGCAATSDGALLVVGTVDVGGVPEAWAAKYARAPAVAPQWQRPIPSPLGPAFASAVVADDAGGGYAVGRTAGTARRWFGRITP